MAALRLLAGKHRSLADLRRRSETVSDGGAARAARGAPAGRLPEDGGAGSQVHAATGRVPAPAPRRAQRAGPTFLPSPSLAPSLLKTEDITYMTDPV